MISRSGTSGFSKARVKGLVHESRCVSSSIQEASRGFFSDLVTRLKVCRIGGATDSGSVDRF